VVDDLKDIRESFVRQRRSLIAVSLVLLFYLTSGLQIKSVNVFGTDLVITSPLKIAIVMWVCWIYFLLRYYQYFRDTPDKGFAIAYGARMHILVREESKKLFKHSYTPLEKYSEPRSFAFNKIDVTETCPAYWDVEMDVDVGYDTQEGVRFHDVKGQDFKLKSSSLTVPKIKAVLHVALSTRFGTEYVLPFIVASFPVIYQIAIWI